ncbi:N-acylglucosamine-6-phosphate 2-epimerase [Xylanimonas cellulosilytica DSM 15894]|uniref:N-acylglucosamine-6-phosphate 2-epimerase n=2 Tax=Xylanimonas TaxID=186188 RepID=D1BUC8_XYLCX|nr:N-acylglucosamine-6-phosphate 2-epimerase [Xylanimonas cellulosilytica DSM 15894]
MRPEPRTRVDVVALLARGIVVSAQTHRSGGPLDDAATLVRLALAAGDGGASAFRVASAHVVELLRSQTALPIIGITKHDVPGYDVYITPTLADATALIDAGADMVAAQAAPDGRPAETFEEIARACHDRGVPVLADCATADEAFQAVDAGADVVATTMAGYTHGTRHVVPPALDLAARLARELPVPVIVEGGVWDREAVAAAFEAGAHAVVVGSAVTDPERITRRLVEAVPALENTPTHR